MADKIKILLESQLSDLLPLIKKKVFNKREVQAIMK